MALGQALLDGPLTFQQPIHGGIQLILVGIGHVKLFTQGCVVPAVRGGQLALRLQHPGGDHCHYEIALARLAPPQPSREVHAASLQ
jgi:hypothetical protein